MNAHLLDSLLPRREFASYEDFAAGFRVNRPDSFNFGFDVIDALAARDPDGLALRWCDDRGGLRDFTMGQIARQSARAANAFREMGVRRGDAVMLILKRRYEYWFAVAGLHKLGAAAIPATHMLTRKDLDYRIRAADVKMIVCVNESPIADAVDEAAAGSGLLRVSVGAPRSGWAGFEEALEAASDRFERPSGADAVDPERDIMLLYFTSGTTGLPKMVRHDFLYPLGHILTARYWQNCRPGCLHFTLADTGWAKASWGKIYGQWIAGSAVMVYDMEKFSAPRVLDVITRHRVTSFCAPPTVYRYFVKEPLAAYDWSHLENCTVAGEPLNPEIFDRFKAATGLSLREGYGQTEMTLALAAFPWMTPKPGSMGRPSPGYDIDLLDEDGRSCETGQEGQLVVRTDRRSPAGLFHGYHRDPDLTRRVWRDGIYRTGDMAWRDEDGYYWFVGRSDDVIKSSGYRIGPFEVESALQEHPSVLECAVTGVPDPERGAVVKATIVLAAGYAPSETLKRELQEHVKNVTAPYKYPRLIEFVTELPKTISGKIRRVAIREDDRRRQSP